MQPTPNQTPERFLFFLLWASTQIVEQVSSDAFWQHQHLLCETASWEWDCNEAMQFSSRKEYGVSTIHWPKDNKQSPSF